MKKINKKNFYIAIGMLLAFLLWTIGLQCIDVQAIGPQHSLVGFATMNQFFHNLIGINMSLYIITDYLSVFPLVIVLGFALLGLTQWIQRKHLLKVDLDILILGGFYIVVIIIYLFFEILAVNYRPILINGSLEVSYPSSTTMLVMCVIPTAIMQFNTRIKKDTLKHFVIFAMYLFMIFMILGRLISGVHWISDIIGGSLLSIGLVLIYRTILLWQNN